MSSSIVKSKSCRPQNSLCARSPLFRIFSRLYVYMLPSSRFCSQCSIIACKVSRSTEKIASSLIHLRMICFQCSVHWIVSPATLIIFLGNDAAFAAQSASLAASISSFLSGSLIIYSRRDSSSASERFLACILFPL